MYVKIEDHSSLFVQMVKTQEFDPLIFLWFFIVAFFIYLLGLFSWVG